MNKIVRSIVDKILTRDSIARVVSRHLESASQQKIDHLMKKYKLNQNVMDVILDTDPTPNGEYLEWIIGRWLNDKLRLPEDSAILKPNLKMFHGLKNRRVFQDSNDIRSYKSPGDLYKTLEKYKDKSDETSDVTKRLEKAGDGYSVVTKGPDYVWYKITKPEAACALGSGTSWCTVQPGYASHYLKEGPLYMLYKGGKPVAQVHFESGQFMDMHDNDLYKTIGYYPAFDILQYATELDDLSSATLEALPEAYRNALPADSAGLLHRVKKYPRLAYEYAKEIIGGRWPEVEDIISTDPTYSIAYASNVIGGRFPKGESAILESLDGNFMGKYARDVFEGGNWKEAEQVLLKAGDVQEAIAYVQKLGHDYPAPLLEDLIAEDGGTALWYYSHILNKDFDSITSPKLKEVLEKKIYKRVFPKSV